MEEKRGHGPAVHTAGRRAPHTMRSGAPVSARLASEDRAALSWCAPPGWAHLTLLHVALAKAVWGIAERCQPLAGG